MSVKAHGTTILVAVSSVALAASLIWIARETSGPGSVTSPSASASVTAPGTSATSPSEGAQPSASTTTPWPSGSALPPPTTSPPHGLSAELLGTDWERIETVRKVVALTFDAGSSDAALGSILGTLAAGGVQATFFVTGGFARMYPADVQRIADAGHVIGNHSDTHTAYPGMTDKEITADLARAEEAIVAAAGVDAKPFFRFPFGDRTPADIRVVNDNGYVCVRWTVDSLGWEGTSGGVTAEIVRRRVIDAAQPGEIVLMHVGTNPDDGSTLDADALPAVIDALRASGYDFVTLSALLASTV